RPSVQVVERALAVDGEGVGVERDVHWPPPDILFRLRMFNDALVFGRATGLGARIRDQRAVFGDARVLFVTDGVFVERARGKVTVHLADDQLVLLERERAHRVSPRIGLL